MLIFLLNHLKIEAFKQFKNKFLVVVFEYFFNLYELIRFTDYEK